LLITGRGQYNGDGNTPVGATCTINTVTSYCKKPS